MKDHHAPKVMFPYGGQFAFGTLHWDGADYRIPGRDHQMSRVYKAERRAFRGRFYAWESEAEPLSEDEVLAFVREVVQSETWARLRERLGKAPGPVPEVQIVSDNRAYARGGQFRLTLPTWAHTKPIVLHELAHTAAGGAARHSWPFVAAFLILVDAFIGREDALRLADEFTARRVQVVPGLLRARERQAATPANRVRVELPNGEWIIA